MPSLLPHHPVVEDFLAGRRSSQGLAEIVFARTSRRRCAAEGCRNLARGVGRSAKFCPVHARVLARDARRERNRRYQAARGPRKTQMPSGPLQIPLIDAGIVR